MEQSTEEEIVKLDLLTSLQIHVQRVYRNLVSVDSLYMGKYIDYQGLYNSCYSLSVNYYIYVQEQIKTMNNQSGFKLEGYNQSASERMLIVMAIGLLHSLEVGKLSVDEVHAHLFNPYTLELLKDLQASQELVDFWHKSLFIEDVESLLPKHKLQETILDLKQRAFDFLSKSTFEPYEENKWVVTD